MTDLREAAEMALEALENSADFIPVKTGLERETNNAIQALRQALTQPNWRGLTDEEKQWFKGCGLVGVDIIEAKLRERNG